MEIDRLSVAAAVVEVVFFIFAVGHAIEQTHQRLRASAQGAAGTIQFVALNRLSTSIVVGAVLARLLSVAIPLPDNIVGDSLQSVAAICYQARAPCTTTTAPPSHP
jgi:hypothetical protein